MGYDKNPAGMVHHRVNPGGKPLTPCPSMGAHALQGVQPSLRCMGLKPIRWMKEEAYPTATSLSLG